MSFIKLPRCPPTELDHNTERSHSASPNRPSFNSQITSDRLRVGSGLRPPRFSMISNIKKDRKSIFKELGLEDDLSDDCSTNTPPEHHTQHHTHKQSMSMSSEKDFGELTRLARDQEQDDDDNGSRRDTNETDRNQQSERQHTVPAAKSWYSKFTPSYRRPRVRTVSSAPPATVSSIQRLSMIALLIAIVLPAFSYNSGSGKVEMNGADAGVIRPRQNSPTQVCTRWSQQVAHLNGTLYMYGGQAKASADQTTFTWNSNFLTLDLTKSWDISSPALKGLPIPSQLPPVSNGYLWNDYNNLYLYGGEFADNEGGPSIYATPDPVSLWRYSVKANTWAEFKELKTSAGNYSSESNVPVQRSAEGAGLSVPELGLSWYFGGHLDLATTPGWSNQIPRVYLTSLLEFTHPGYMNDGVYALAGGSGAADGGVFRNITAGGLQEDPRQFSERADGVLVFVPGWGKKGVLIGLAGGTDSTFVHDLSRLDVFDIATSEWYHQDTTGTPPGVRVNPCTVIASAPDASSFQIYFFGGQNLQPFKEQIQYNDMYILSIPAFTWIHVEMGDGVPPPRAGHTCTMRDAQMIVIGGYVGKNIPCDSPGVYVFDTSELKWTNRFQAGDHVADLHPENGVLAGSFNYRVPGAVQSVIGGNSEGGATATTPAAGPATGGPFATGTPPVFTITRSGSTATITQPAPSNPPSNGGGVEKAEEKGPNVGLIAAGVIAGLLGILAGYLGFCAWLYRRQVAAYKQHLAVVNRYSGASAASFGGGAAMGGMFGRGRTHRREESTASDETFGWVGAPVEPKWLAEEPSTGPTGSGSASGSGSGLKRKSEDVRSGHGSRDARTTGSDGDSVSSTEQLLEGQEPSFFSVVLGPRRALRVVNGIDEGR